MWTDLIKLIVIQILSVPKSCLNMVKLQLDAFEAYGHDENVVKERFSPSNDLFFDVV